MNSRQMSEVDAILARATIRDYQAKYPQLISPTIFLSHNIKEENNYETQRHLLPNPSENQS